MGSVLNSLRKCEIIPPSLRNVQNNLNLRLSSTEKPKVTTTTTRWSSPRPSMRKAKKPALHICLISWTFVVERILHTYVHHCYLQKTNVDEFDISTLLFRIVEEDESTDPAFVAPDSGRATGEGGAVEVSDVSTLTDDEEGQDVKAVCF